MLREDFLFLLPVTIIILYQIFFVWGRLPEYNEDETKISGEYSSYNFLVYDYSQFLIAGILLIQLSMPIFSITESTFQITSLRIIGYIFVLLGFFISLKALKDLGSSWTGMMQFRIKKNQKLITAGAYKYIRHPLYLAVILELVGFELVATSWLFIVLLVSTLVLFDKHIKKEEKLLEDYYQEAYRIYKQKTKKLLPRIY